MEIVAISKRRWESYKAHNKLFESYKRVARKAMPLSVFKYWERDSVACIASWGERDAFRWCRSCSTVVRQHVRKSWRKSHGAVEGESWNWASFDGSDRWDAMILFVGQNNVARVSYHPVREHPWLTRGIKRCWHGLRPFLDLDHLFLDEGTDWWIRWLGCSEIMCIFVITVADAGDILKWQYQVFFIVHYDIPTWMKSWHTLIAIEGNVNSIIGGTLDGVGTSGGPARSTVQDNGWVGPISGSEFNHHTLLGLFEEIGPFLAFSFLIWLMDIDWMGGYNCTRDVI